MSFPHPSSPGGDPDYDSMAEHGPTNFFIAFVIAFALIIAGIVLIVQRDLPWLPIDAFRNSYKHAIGTGIVFIGAGLVLHFRIFWQHHRPDVWYTTLGTIIGLLTLIAGAVVITLRFARLI